MVSSDYLRFLWKYARGDRPIGMFPALGVVGDLSVELCAEPVDSIGEA